MRFHGPAATEVAYRGRYGLRRLTPVAEQMRAWLDQGKDVFAYFNNDYEGHAVADADTLRTLLSPTHEGQPTGVGLR